MFPEQRFYICPGLVHNRISRLFLHLYVILYSIDCELTVTFIIWVQYIFLYLHLMNFGIDKYTELIEVVFFVYYFESKYAVAYFILIVCIPSETLIQIKKLGIHQNVRYSTHVEYTFHVMLPKATFYSKCKIQEFDEFSMESCLGLCIYNGKLFIWVECFE